MSEGKSIEVTFRPIKYKAIQYRPDIPNCNLVVEWIGVEVDECDFDDEWHKKESFAVPSKGEDVQWAQPGDWIVALVRGEKYQVVSDSTFKCMYKEVNVETD